MLGIKTLISKCYLTTSDTWSRKKLESDDGNLYDIAFLLWRLDKTLEIKIKNNHNMSKWFWASLKYIENL